MTLTLPPQPWMTAGPAAMVMEALQAAAGPDAARFVGGCVRDALLGRPMGDIDVATPLRPEAVSAALEAAGLRAVPTGADHGTITAVALGQGVEITTLRRDVETDGRRAVVSFTEDWSEDAARRDFRLNALYLDPSGVLYDPTGGGVEDARGGRIIFVGDPVQRIREDYLRILRFFRFYAAFGRGEPDPEAISACAQERAGLASLSAERVSREMLKLLAAEDPRPALRAMRQSGVLAELLPEADTLDRAEALIEIESDILFEADPLVRLAALTPPDESAAAAVMAKLRLPNAAAARFLAMFRRPYRIVSWLSPREMRRAVHGLGAVAFKDQVKLAWAEGARPAAGPQWRLLLVYPDTWTIPSLPLSGEEIMAAGVPKGPLVGEVRREVETWWIDLDFTEDKMALLERLKAVVQGLVY